MGSQDTLIVIAYDFVLNFQAECPMFINCKLLTLLAAIQNEKWKKRQGYWKKSGIMIK
ncbi:hypothetical protein SAMN05421788_10782 [Filimonas lacunae]|uniref:Uncharacterized protein n=1 Tax=Filimonas lacunae TaxID=477680 RepID=A0A1N7QVU5_9BACT|nr:hypothetical protein SAMN05421788_10782 [Filimonas lacunae]